MRQNEAEYFFLFLLRRKIRSHNFLMSTSARETVWDERNSVFNRHLTWHTYRSFSWYQHLIMHMRKTILLSFSVSFSEWTDKRQMVLKLLEFPRIKTNFRNRRKVEESFFENRLNERVHCDRHSLSSRSIFNYEVRWKRRKKNISNWTSVRPGKNTSKLTGWSKLMTARRFSSVCCLTLFWPHRWNQQSVNFALLTFRRSRQRFSRS